MDEPTITAPAVLTIELTQGNLNAMVQAAVQAAVKREVARRMPDYRITEKMIRAEVAHTVRAVAQGIAAVEIPRVVTGWLEAREGWVAKMAMRAMRCGAVEVPDAR